MTKCKCKCLFSQIEKVMVSVKYYTWNLFIVYKEVFKAENHLEKLTTIKLLRGF